MKQVIKLTNQDNQPILIGVESIIAVSTVPSNLGVNPKFIGLSKIQSRGAIVETNWVKESVEEIYNLINS